MDATVKQIGAVVVEALHAAGYLDSTIGQYEKTIRALAVFVEEHGGVYTPALGAVFASMTVSPRTGRFSAQRRLGYRRLVGVFDGYLSTGQVDLSVRTRGGGGPRPDSGAFTALDAAWEADMDARGLARAPAPPTAGSRAVIIRCWSLGGLAISTSPMGPVCWRFWNRSRADGRLPRCSGWCRISARS